MKINAVLFRCIDPVTILLALWQILIKRRKVYYFEVDRFSFFVILKLLKKGTTKKLFPLGHITSKCYGNALDSIEIVYQTIRKDVNIHIGSLPIAREDEVQDIFKKQILYDLSYFYYYDEIIGREIHESSIIIFDAQYRYFKSILQLPNNPEIVQCSIISIILLSISDWSKNIFKWYTMILTIFLILVRSFVNKSSSNQRNIFKYAVAINGPSLQLRSNLKYLDFLLDGQSINSKNTLFVESSPLTTDQRLLVTTKGYLLSESLQYRNLIENSNSKDLLHLLKILSRYTLLSFLFIPQQSIMEARKVVILAVIRWSLFIAKYDVENYITFNDEHSSHIIRTILLRRDNATSWYYSHSASLSYSLVPEHKFNEVRHVLWSYLMYDNFVTWNEAISKYISLHPVKFSNIYIIGCLWSSFIKKSSINSSKNKILAFDTSYSDNIDKGIKFYSDLISYVEARSNIKLIFKPKKHFSDYSSNKYYWATPRIAELIKLIKSVENHPRISFFSYDQDSYDLMSNADVIITDAISSPTIEALCAGKKSIFYDPNADYTGTFYDSIPGFIVKSKQELYRTLDSLIDMDDVEYRKILIPNAQGIIDDYFDTGAVSRFRDIMTKNNTRDIV